MTKAGLTEDAIRQALADSGGNKSEAARALGVPRTTLRRLVANIPLPTEGVEISGPTDAPRLVVRDRSIHTVEGALEKAQVDTNKWEIANCRIRKSDSAAKLPANVGGGAQINELWHIAVDLKRKSPLFRSAEQLLKDMRAASVKVPKYKRPKIKGKPSRALEICIMDPHLGLECFRPGSDHAWSLDQCEQFFLWAVDSLLEKARSYAPFEKILWIFGNDFLHCDTVFGTTTKGTPQPEAISYATMYERGKLLAIACADRISKVAPLEILQVSGNHDRTSSFSLAHVLDAYYHQDANVSVAVDPSPYRFWQYGVNLLGFEHGHSAKVAHLAALMANECRLKGWAEARYCEWHLGDQHRKGAARPTVLAEQGVGVEFLVGLTPANEWHKLKTLNWQPRGAAAYVWNKKTGPEARLYANIDSYTGRPLGE